MDPRVASERKPPLLRCPKCERPLVWHYDVPEKDKSDRVEVWQCLVHGDYRYFPDHDGDLIHVT